MAADGGDVKPPHLVSCWVISSNFTTLFLSLCLFLFWGVFDAESNVSIFKVFKDVDCSTKIGSIWTPWAFNSHDFADGWLCWCRVVIFISFGNNTRVFWWVVGKVLAIHRHEYFMHWFLKQHLKCNKVCMISSCHVRHYSFQSALPFYILQIVF